MYLDPSFGTMLVQILVALMAAGGALAFSFRRKISAFFNRKKGGQETAPVSEFKEVDPSDVIDTIDD